MLLHTGGQWSGHCGDEVEAQVLLHTQAVHGADTAVMKWRLNLCLIPRNPEDFTRIEEKGMPAKSRAGKCQGRRRG